MQKAKAIGEVIIVLSLILLLIALTALSPAGRWERQVLRRPFIEYGVMIAASLLGLAASRRKPAACGLSWRHLAYQLDIAATVLVPAAIGSAACALVDYKEWSGALVLAAVQIAVLVTSAWLLRRKPTQNQNNYLAGLALPVASLNLALQNSVGDAVSAFIFYVFFLGLGEELLFRGYIQSRLNVALGRPFQFWGIRWGWGIVITSALFGGMHVLNLGGLASGQWELTWWWGFWTFWSGLVFGLVREKSGGIIASVILHGLPQAIASAVTGLG